MKRAKQILSCCLFLSLGLSIFIALQIQARAASPKQLHAENVLTQAPQTKWFLEGKKDAPHQVYMIAEPNCSVCHLLYEKLQPFVKSGQLSIRWILVAFIRPDSAGKAARIWSSHDQAAALAKDETGFSMAKESGGLKAVPNKDISASMKFSLRGNMMFFQQSGFVGTPALIYRNKDGKAALVAGYPKGDIKAFIAKVGTLKAANKKS